MQDHAHATTPISSSLNVTVDGKTATLSLADLRAMPQKSVIVHNAHTKLDETYSGVSVGGPASEVWLCSEYRNP